MREINRLYNSTVFPSINRKVLGIKADGDRSASGIEQFKRGLDVGEYLLQLHYRLVDVGRSLAFMSFFFQLGIPDDEWYISPGKRGQSIEYLPHFKARHHLIKDWFDYYEDDFLFKAFSAIDMVGQLLNAYFSLGFEETQASFFASLRKMETARGDLYGKLVEIAESQPFKKAAAMRNSGTHRRLTSSVGMTVTSSKKSVFRFGTGPYVTTREVMRVAGAVAMSLDRVVDALSLHLR